MKQRLLVVNGSKIVQAEEGGAWSNKKVEKARALKPGIYNIFNAKEADKAIKYEGVVVHSDKESGVYQQIGKSFVMHRPENFDILPHFGENKSIMYNKDGKAQVENANIKLSRGLSR